MQGDPNNLHVALIDQNTLEVQFSSFPVDSFAFAFADHSINTADGGLGTCFITDGGAGGGDLTFAHSLNGLDYQLILIDTIDQYDSCAIINRCITSVNLNTCCDDIAVVAHNVTDDTIDEYRSSNGGMDWTDEGTLVPDACGPLDGCIVPNAVNNRLGGYTVLYSELTGFGEFDNNLFNTTTGFTQKVAEDAVNAAVLKESCAVESTDFSVFYGYVTIDNSVHAITADNTFGLPGGAPAEDVVLGDAPDFNAPGQQNFFGMGCNRFPQGPENPERFLFSTYYAGGNT
ncbi:MAG: hypothetical protein IH964_12365 [Candidatus Dadabacteria bacterium]|nr:hypothetical protein [Candidatus Dadabacteria bacterium]